MTTPSTIALSELAAKGAERRYADASLIKIIHLDQQRDAGEQRTHRRRGALLRRLRATHFSLRGFRYL